MKTSELIDKAADKLDASPWFRGSYTPNDYNSRCVLTSFSGLVGGTTSETLQYSDAKLALQRAIKELYGLENAAIAYWNDCAAESKEQAVDMMRYAAKLARMGEEE